MNWQAFTAIVASVGVAATGVIYIIRLRPKLEAQEKQLASHSRQHEEHFKREFETAKSLERTSALLDQVEKRVTRIEDQDDASRD